MMLKSINILPDASITASNLENYKSDIKEKRKATNNLDDMHGYKIAVEDNQGGKQEELRENNEDVEEDFKCQEMETEV